MDLYEGNIQDPQSLHKYLYCHNNPVNNIDPAGEMASLANVVVTSSIIGAIVGSILGGISSGFQGAVYGAIRGLLLGPIMALGCLGLGLAIAAIAGITATSGLFISFALAISGSLALNIYSLITARSARERLAAGVAIIFTLGFAAFGFYQFSKLSTLPSNASSKGAVLPKSKGALGRFLSEAAAAFRGERVVAREVTVKTKGGVKVRLDLVVKTILGKIKFIESKNGPNARFTPNQKIAYPEIAESGGIIAGDNGASAGLPNGTNIGPTSVQVDTWNGAELGNL